MPTELTQEQADTLEEITGQQGWEIRAYVGRGSFGADPCLAVVIDDAGDLLTLGVSLQMDSPELADLLVNAPMRLDTMGRDREIAYWPAIKVGETSLAEDGDDDGDEY